MGLRVNYEVSDLWQVATPERDSISVPSRQSCFFAETFRSQDILVVCPVVVLKLAVTICVALYQGFLTWGAEINCRGCWERSHMWHLRPDCSRDLKVVASALVHNWTNQRIFPTWVSWLYMLGTSREVILKTNSSYVSHCKQQRRQMMYCDLRLIFLRSIT